MLIKSHFHGQFRTRVLQEHMLDENGNHLPGAQPVWDSGFNCNIILDNFFTKFISDSVNNKSRRDLISHLVASEDTTAPGAGDTSITQLGTRIALTFNVWSAEIIGNKIVQTVNFRGGKGQIQGTVGKVAIFDAASDGTMVVSSLIKDSEGVPITLPLGELDYFYVSWKVESTINLSDVTGVINVPGQGDFNFVMRPCYWNDLSNNGFNNSLACICGHARPNSAVGFSRIFAYSTQVLGSVTGGPSDGVPPVSMEQSNAEPYVSGLKERDYSYLAGEGDFYFPGGIGSIVLCNPFSLAGYQISFSKVSDGSKLPKINTRELNLVMTYAFSR